jgi:cell division protein FtsN
MSRDYKPPTQTQSNSKGNPLITGLLIGFLLGVGITVGLMLFIKGTSNPFENKDINAPSNESLAAKTPKPKPENKQANDESALPKKENPNGSANGNDYDFYTILPDSESTVTEQEIKANAQTVKKDSYFLQVGAFPNQDDADNMKAKLALQGFEAVVQTASISDKGTWHRVRVGPLTSIEQINKVRGELTAAGFNTDLIKIHTETPPQ